MKSVSKVLILLGIAGVIIFGIRALNQSESFNFLGVDVAVSSANWTPLIISGVVLAIGLVLRLVRKG